MDAFAICYAVALLVTFALSVRTGSPPRMYTAALLASAWMVTIALQNGAGALALPIQFGLLDLALVVSFALLAWVYREEWAWWVSAFHVAMLLTHFAFQVSLRADPFVYLSLLAGLGYLSMIFTCVPGVIDFIGRAWRGIINVAGVVRRRLGGAVPVQRQEKTKQERTR